MASNKNQHFVPKVYLRCFSGDPQEASVSLFNLTRRRAVPHASISGQCSSNYFYGENNEFEARLQSSESLYGYFLKELKAGTLKLGQDETNFLRHFVYLQFTRTAAQAQRTLSFMMGMANFAFDNEPPPEYVPDALETVQLAIKNFQETQLLIADLKVRLVRNRTPIDFIASDNPSVHTNRWHLQSPKAGKKSPGISSAGAMFFMPITPRWLCAIYDGDVYTTSHNGSVIDLTREDDVRALNEHQFLNCQSNVYFKNWDTRDEIAAACDLVAARRPASRHEVITAVLDSEDAWGQNFKVVPQEEARKHGKAMIHSKEIYPVPSRWPNFVKLRNTPRIYTNGTGTGFVRAWSLKHRDYSGTNYRKLK